MTDRQHEYDVIIIGGGPAGATAGLQLGRAGKKVLILEKQRFPRFHVGETMLPAVLKMVSDLGLRDRFEALPHIDKHGAEFGFGDTADADTLRFGFTSALTPGPLDTFNVERKLFDGLLLDAAREAGAEVRESSRVTSIDRLAHHDVAVTVDGQTITAKWLLDASGQAAVVGRHLKTKRVIASLRNTAFFGHFTGVKRLADDQEGYPSIVMCDEGWFWIIAINPTVTSCGVVLNQQAIRKAGVPRDQMLRWAAERCPLVARRLEHATFPKANNVNSDYTYTCEPYAGDGYFLIGDSATFLDPIFSTGVGLGMYGGIESARLIGQIDDGQTDARAAQDEYIRLVRGSSKHLFQLVHSYYSHTFRELMMNGTGPVQMHRSIISLLAGHVFPKAQWKVVWRFKAMQYASVLQRFLPLVPRHKRFSLLASEPVSLPGPHAQPTPIAEPVTALA
ncbi:MAG: NAD(P)/FAD-dependent oxidoreductase [Planctomycetota bacterium]